MKTMSLWNAFGTQTNFPILSEDLKVDAAIIGGGITGITTAHELSKAGLSVVLLEARTIGGGTTSHSTGNLYVYDKYITQIRKNFGMEAAKILVEARTKALHQIRQNISHFNIDCDDETTPWIAYASEGKAISKIEEQYKVAMELGLPVKWSDTQGTPYHSLKGIRLEGQAQFNPSRYVSELALSIQNLVQIYENSPVDVIEHNENIVWLTTPKGKIEARYLIHATHTPKGFSPVQTLLGPYREYGIACKIKESHPKGIFWGYTSPDDLISTRTYIRDGSEYLIVVGHPHKVGQAKSNLKEIEALEQFARKHFTVEEIPYHWGGQHYRPADQVPYIGRTSKNSNVFLATGFATDGLTYGTVAAKIIHDQIMDIENPASVVMSPSRFTPVKSAGHFLKENANSAKEFVKGWLKSEGKDLVDVARGEGKVITREGHKLAVHRDEENNVHVCSAVCPHLFCIVDWNDAEKSWDCPCHGSRFDSHGQVLEGPSLSDLTNLT